MILGKGAPNMIKMTVYLLVGISAMMYFADDLAKPESANQSDVAVADEPTEIIEPEIASDSVSILDGLSFASITTTETDVAPEPIVEESVTLVPFMEPTIVNSDGSIAITPTPIEVALVAANAVVEEIAAEPIIDVWFVTARSVNVRAGPSTSNGVLGRVVYAEAVELLSDPTDDWVHIRIEGDGVEGFMASRFLQKEDPQG